MKRLLLAVLLSVVLFAPQISEPKTPFYSVGKDSAYEGNSDVIVTITADKIEPFRMGDYCQFEVSGTIKNNSEKYICCLNVYAKSIFDKILGSAYCYLGILAPGEAANFHCVIYVPYDERMNVIKITYILKDK